MSACSTSDSDADPSALAVAISDRHLGVGSDGLILIGPSERADARMRMFNADGSEGEMCGNGVRCVAKYIHDHGIARQDRVTVETGRGVLTLDMEAEGGQGAAGPGRHGDADPRVGRESRRPCPATRRSTCRSRSPAHELRLTCVSMGNPHAVAYVDDVAALPGRGDRRRCWSATRRSRGGSTPTSSQVIGPGEVRMRTWERGSGITLACGTGACAVCVAGVLTGRTGRRMLAHLPGGDLELEWPADDASVFMTGPAVEVFTGEWPDA